MNEPKIAPATRADRAALRRLQERSFRELGLAYYDTEVLEAFISHVGTMDEVLIDDGTYFKVDLEGELVGCGGWSTRAPGYAGRVVGEQVAESRPIATVRSVFVHPGFARRGVARLLMWHIETAIAEAGFERATLMATLSGIPLYRRTGYRSLAPVVVRLPNDLLFISVMMEKRLAEASVDLVPAA